MSIEEDYHRRWKIPNASDRRLCSEESQKMKSIREKGSSSSSSSARPVPATSELSGEDIRHNRNSVQVGLTKRIGRSDEISKGILLGTESPHIPMPWNGRKGHFPNGRRPFPRTLTAEWQEVHGPTRVPEEKQAVGSFGICRKTSPKISTFATFPVHVMFRADPGCENDDVLFHGEMPNS
jgi:hypothetical protein